MGLTGAVALLSTANTTTPGTGCCPFATSSWKGSEEWQPTSLEGPQEQGHSRMPALGLSPKRLEGGTEGSLLQPDIPGQSYPPLLSEGLAGARSHPCSAPPSPDPGTQVA